MIRFLLPFLAPGESIPPGTTRLSISAEGISWGMALALFVILTGALVWSYLRYAGKISGWSRAGLIVLRIILIALLLLLLVHPVLLVALEDKEQRPLFVLLDLSQSMTLKDRRGAPDDRAREAIAQGLVDPSGGLQAYADNGQLQDVSRAELLEAVAANDRLNLWPQLRDKARLDFYGFGRSVSSLGELGPAAGKLTPEQSAAFFHGLHYDQNLTALGDGLRHVLDEQRGQPSDGIVLITDGANNSGTPPLEAADIARQDGVPLYIYGVGITAPQDIIVTDLKAPASCNVDETTFVTVHMRVQNMIGKHATLQLMADGKKVDEQAFEIRADGNQEFRLNYTPTKLGETELKAYVPPLPEESSHDNNAASTKLRVVDTKLNVLIVEGQPGWDFQYLLAMLQRDRRFKVKCFLVHGDAGLAGKSDSPFLDQLPEDKDFYTGQDIVILGDVDPTFLGETRMKLLADWVNSNEGGLLFLAGPRFDPAAYSGTPLRPLLPVDPVAGTSDSYPDPVKLHLTPAGAASPLLQVAPVATDNQATWDGFPGVNWTARVGAAHAGAQVLLADPSQTNAAGPMAVMAEQAYGDGKSFYIGTDQTYLWRSGVGEKYYTQIWGQILQSLASQRTQNPATLTQLSSDRPGYFTGDQVTISARLFKSTFQPVTDAEVPGKLVIHALAAAGHPAPAAQTQEVKFEAQPGHPGLYTGQFTAETAGSYSYSVERDPAVVLKFDVAESSIELDDTALNEPLLKQMASISGGAFFREEDLHDLPSRIGVSVSKSDMVKKVPLAFSPFLLVIMIVSACLEWFWRRRLELK